MHYSSAKQLSDDFDTRCSFVRVVKAREDGFIEFEFAIGEPELFVELLLKHEDFMEFCHLNKVRVLPSEADGSVSLPDLGWRLSDVQKSLHKNKK